MKKVVLVMIIFLLSTAVLAHDYKEIYVQLLNEGKYEELYQHLQKWEEVAADDPELYIAYFNYYYNLSRNEVLKIKKNPPPGEVIVVNDPETGEEVGYLYFEIQFDEEKVNKALEYLDEGLKRYPNRLDMHFGKIHVLGELSRYEEQKNAIIDVLNISKEIENRWLWHNGEELADAFDFMLENVQGRISKLYNDDNEDDFLLEISWKIIELYPDVVYPYNNIAVVYYSRGNYQEALKYFTLAEEKNPRDTIVINNIAYLSMIMGDNKTALEYYEKLREYGNDEEKERAEQQIEELKQYN